MRELLGLLVIVIGFLIFDYITATPIIEKNENETEIIIIRDSLLYEKYEIDKL
jgi:hypothetical protein